MSICPRCQASFGAGIRLCPHDGTPLPDDPALDPLIGRLLEGKYRIDAFISAGGMGAVYRATHVMLDKTVAIKLIRKELVQTAEASARFQREARAASALNHPNIATVFDFGQTGDGALYIAMEYVEGPSLKQIIQQGGPMDPGRIVAILGPVASALAQAHRLQIVHRDLKPHNIMLATGTDNQETPKLLDFGIAKTAGDPDGELTMTGFALGTPQYMSPEQATGKRVDGRSDLYSLGVVLYEMLIGEVPFADTSVAGVLLKQMTEVPDAPSRRRPDVPISPALEAIALRCLDKEPDRRIQSADEFMASLEGVTSAAAADSAAASGAALAAAAGDALTRMPGPSARATVEMAETAATPSALARPVPSGMAFQPPAENQTAGAGAVPPPEAPPSPVAVPDAAVGAPAVGPAPVPGGQGARRGRPATQPTVVVATLAAGQSIEKGRSSPSQAFWLSLSVVVLIVIGSSAWVILGWIVPSGRTAESSEAPTATPAMAQPTAPAGAEAPLSQAPAAGATERPQTPPPAPAAPGGARLQATAPAATSAPAAAPPPRPPSPPAAPSYRDTAGQAPAAPPRSMAPDAGGGDASATAAAPAIVQSPARAEPPTVFVQCAGPVEICSPVRAAIADALKKERMPMAAAAQRADVTLTFEAAEVEQRVQQSFGTTLAPRTYTIDVSGEAHGLVLSMPPARTFSFDSQVGRERATENARLMASDTVDKVRDFWKQRP